MSMNVRCNVKKMENLHVSKIDMSRVVKGDNYLEFAMELPDTEGEPEVWKLRAGEDYSKGRVDGNMLVFDEFKLYGEGSGSDWEAMKELLYYSRGTLILRQSWDGGEVWFVEVVDGKILEYSDDRGRPEPGTEKYWKPAGADKEDEIGESASEHTQYADKNCCGCGAKPGELHREGCNRSICAICGARLLQCGHLPEGNSVHSGVESQEIKVLCEALGMFVNMTNNGWKPCSRFHEGAAYDLKGGTIIYMKALHAVQEREKQGK